MRLRPLLAVAMMCALSGTGALALRAVAGGASTFRGDAVVLALAVPNETSHGERYVAYVGMRVDRGHGYAFRLCDDSGDCPVRRTGNVAVQGDTWTWLATYSSALPAGDYSGEFFLRAPGLLGVERTVEYFRWLHHVQ